MNPAIIGSIGLIVFGLGDFAHFVLIFFRLAMRNAPRWFCLALAPAMVGSAACCFVMARMALTGDDTLGPFTLVGVFVGLLFCQAARAWAMVLYAVLKLGRKT